MDRVLAYLEVNQLAFLNICITTGCDYLPNVKGVGINKAKKLVKENDDFLHHLIQIPGAPEGYENQFVSARAVFQHQTIINPDNLTEQSIRTINQIIHNAVLLFMYQFSLNVQTFVSLIPFYNLYITSIITVFLHYHHNIIH